MAGGILIKGGHVIDPSQGINEKMDLEVTGNRISDISLHISGSSDAELIDATGKIVVPGLIDLHTHLAEHITPGLGINADKYCLVKGTTTAVDAGSTGELTFNAFGNFVVNSSKTDIYAFLNIESLGMLDYPHRITGQEWPELMLLDGEKYYGKFVNYENIEKLVRKDGDIIKGIKWAHHGSESARIAAEIGSKLGIPLMLENHHMPDAIKRLKAGDIVTHIFHNAFNENAGRIDGMLDPDGNIYDEFFSAKKRGILFDVGHGSGSFSWDVARKAIDNDLAPDIISTDLWSTNINGPVYDLTTTMSKFLYIGLPLEEIIKAVTLTPSIVIKKEGTIGTFKPGAKGDVAILSKQSKPGTLIDSYGTVKKAENIISVEGVIKNGVVIR